uniref:Uncharacterized protein n=1 Tax=Nyctotherus ovalis TaxID=70075 RepID=A6MI48_NYCOV|nr:hypothetical protein [Nyctotherus ovalis]
MSLMYILLVSYSFLPADLPSKLSIPLPTTSPFVFEERSIPQVTHKTTVYKKNLVNKSQQNIEPLITSHTSLDPLLMAEMDEVSNRKCKASHKIKNDYVTQISLFDKGKPKDLFSDNGESFIKSGKVRKKRHANSDVNSSKVILKTTIEPSQEADHSPVVTNPLSLITTPKAKRVFNITRMTSSDAH